MLFLKRLFNPPKFQAEGRALFGQIGAQARRPILYTAFGVPDTLDGRFEMLCLHVYGVFHRLKGHGEETDALSQALYDAMFEELDAALRELGVADLGVGRRIKIMTEALNGRIQAYDQGLASGEDKLRDTIRRNIYGTVAASDAQVAAMAGYLRAIRDALAEMPIADLRAGRIRLPQPVPPVAEEARNATG